MALADLGKVPKGDGADEKKERRQILNHLFLLDEKLRYMFQNIDPEENFSPNAFQHYIDTGKRITSLQIADGKITAMIKDINGNISSIHMTIEGIETHVQNIDGDISNIIQKADKITLRVRNTEGKIGQLEIRAGKIESSIVDTKKQLSSQITQTAESINQRVTNVQQGLHSEISQTAESINQRVTNIQQGLHSEIIQTAESINQRVTNVQQGLHSEISQTASSIRQSVSDLEGYVSRVEQTADKIDWIVAGGGSASGFTLTNKMAQLISDQIEIWGPVTFRDLETEGRTTINGGNITTGKVDVRYIDLYGKIDVYENQSALGGSGGSFGFGRGANGGYGMMMENFFGSGQIIVTDDGARLSFGGNAIYCSSRGGTCDGDFYIKAGDVQVDDGNVRLMRGNLGIRRGDLYLNAEPIIKSDRRAKKEFLYHLSAYEQFFSLLRPCGFRLADGESGRLHMGFISQDVEEALQKSGISAKDFAGFVKTPIYAKNEEGEILERGEISDFAYALRYGEFVSLNTHMIQRLMKRVEELEKRVAALEKQ